jgi:hypothetical protein
MEGYQLETERVRTAEMQAPIRRGGSRGLLLAGGAALLVGVGVVVGLFGPGGEESEPPSSHVAAPHDEPAPEPAAAPTAAAPLELPRAPDPALQQPAATAAIAAQPAPAPAPVPAAAEREAGDAERRERRAASKARDAAASAAAKRGAETGRAEAPAKPAPPPPAPAPAPAPAAPAAATGPSAGELVQQASAAFIQGQMPRARSLYREATGKATSNADAWRGLGMVSSRMGQREEAKRAFERYLQLRPGAADAAAIRKKLDEL